jgi:DNA polymerase-3 subunit delta'
MLTDNSAALLPTILSRCILYKILPLKPDEVYNCLVNKGYDSSLLSTVRALSEGSIGKAIELLNDEEYIRLRNDVLDIIRKFDKQGVPDILLLTKELEKYKDKPDSFLDIMYLWYRDALIYKSTRSKQYLIQTDKVSSITHFCENTDMCNIINGIDAVFNAKTALKYNANFKLAMDVMLLKIAGA